jgi:hypothetical protein
MRCALTWGSTLPVSRRAGHDPVDLKHGIKLHQKGTWSNLLFDQIGWYCNEYSLGVSCPSRLNHWYGTRLRASHEYTEVPGIRYPRRSLGRSRVKLLKCQVEHANTTKQKFPLYHSNPDPRILRDDKWYNPGWLRGITYT